MTLAEIEPDQSAPPTPSNGLKETTFDGITYVAPTWEQMGAFTRVLAHKINQSGESFDLMIPLAKGGLTWSRILADRIRNDHLIPIRIQRYTGINTAGEPVITQPLPHRIDGKGVLIFDEVIDKGVTMLTAIDHAKKMGAAKVKVATLCYKPHAREITGAVPDFHAFETPAWVAFPHEVREFIEGEAKKWLTNNNKTIAEVKARLIEIGMPHEDVEDYVNPLRNLEIQTILGLKQ